MNSLIIGVFISLWTHFKGAFCKSKTYALFIKIYNFFSNGLKNSVMLNLIGNTSRESTLNKSIVYKFFRLPFTFWEFVSDKTGSYINTKIKTSAICTFAKGYIQGFMSLNLRFWGVLSLSASLSYTLLRFVSTKDYSLPVVIIGAIGAVLTLFKCNLMGYLNDSKIVGFIKSVIGFQDIDFNFYNKNCLNVNILSAVLVGIITGIAMVYANLYGLLIPFALFGMILVMYAPITGVYAAVFLAAIIPTMLLALICIWTTLSFLIKALCNKGFKWKLDATGLGLLILLTILFVSSALSFAMVKSLTVWAMYFVFIIFFIIVVNAVETKEQLYGLIKVFIISGALVALYGILQYLFGWTTTNAWIDEEMFEEETMRVYSTLENPNVLGEFLLLVLPLAAVQFIKNKATTLAKYGYLAIFCVLALCLVLTQSRGCWLGFILSVAVFITFWQGKLWGLLPVAICIIPFVIPQTIADRIMSIGNMEDTSTSYRVFIWLGTLGMLKHYWLGGIGMGEGAFGAVYPFFSYNAIIAPHSHNTFLQLTVEAGIGALVVFLVTQFIFIKGMAKTYRLDNKKNTDSLTALAFASAILGFLLQSMFDYTFYNYRVMALFFMVMAMGISLKYIKERENG